MPTIEISPTRQTEPARPRRLSSASDRRNNPDVRQAGLIIAGREPASLDRLTTLAASLESQRYYDLARRLYGQARAMPDAQANARRLAERHARCTYKDADLRGSDRFDAAMAILDSIGMGHDATQESLGIAGAIAKGRWLSEGRRQHLEQSRIFYLRGYQAGIQRDDGYTAINAAFVLDSLASLEETEGETDNALAKRDEAARIRREIIEKLVPNTTARIEAGVTGQWWLLVTIAEAYFGLRQYPEARAWLRTALNQDADEWQFESTARQLATLARLHDGPAPPETDAHPAPAWATLADILGGNANALRCLDFGKVGLALSGGGFRAALYHIGVLARLAEIDMLRHVEVLSCVSGGSIIGAHYYLELRNLLQQKDDGAITREDYIAIVQRIETGFLQGVQRNIRTRLAVNPLAGLRTAFIPHASLTQRLGLLYEREIFSRVADDGKRVLNELIVRPLGEPDDFAPKFDNWRRAAKVPTLILNATTLNTGHNWQFTATWMGEPPANAKACIDGNEELRRLYYWQAPPPHNQVRLGDAVAASSSVPGLFDPLEISGLYEGRTIQLVDGGVHDNQGIAGLLEQECGTVLVSDASGQMRSVPQPGKEMLDVPVRANAILMARVRAAEHAELAARQRSSLIRGLLFIHLRKGLDAAPVEWEHIAPEDRLDRTGTKNNTRRRTDYGVDKEIQQLLATIRTDLDSFSDQEAQALMLSGYLMTTHELPQALPRAGPLPAPAAWKFLAMAGPVQNLSGNEVATTNLAGLLATARHIGFKAWRCSRPLRAASMAASAAVLALAVRGLWKHRAELHPFFLAVSPWIVGIVPLLVIACILWPRVFLAKSVTQFATGLAIATFGWLAAWLHLQTTDRLYLRSGAAPRPARTRG